MKTAYYVSRESGVEYFATVKAATNDTTVKLVRSKFGQWSAPHKGKVAAKLHSNGNGVDVTVSGNKTFRLDYLQASELLFLLREYSANTPLCKDVVRLPLAKKTD